MLISVILVTHNSLDYLRKCIAQICLCSKDPFELIIVDNGSKDGTQKWLKQASMESHFMKEKRIIYNKENRFFTRAVNQGIHLAKGDYYAVINADVVVTDNWLPNIIKGFQKKPLAAAIAPLVGGVLTEPRNLFNQCYENRFGKLPFKYPPASALRGFAKSHALKYKGSVTEAKVISFACVVLRRDVVQSIGGLDEGFLLRGDDWEWCLRARMAGYRVYIADDVFVLHYTVGSIKTIDSSQRRKMYKVDNEHWLNVLYSLYNPQKQPIDRLTLDDIRKNKPFLDVRHRFPDEKLLTWDDLFVNAYSFCYGE